MVFLYTSLESSNNPLKISTDQLQTEIEIQKATLRKTNQSQDKIESEQEQTIKNYT